MIALRVWEINPQEKKKMRSKDMGERLREAIEIRGKMRDLGLEPVLPPTFKQACDRFVRGGEGSSGTISLPDTNRRLVYKFVLRHGVPSEVSLRAA